MRESCKRSTVEHMSNHDIATALIARRTRRGYGAADSAKLLNELVAAHSGDNLAHALVYEGFATEAAAYKAIARLAA